MEIPGVPNDIDVYLQTWVDIPLQQVEHVVDDHVQNVHDQIHQSLHVQRLAVEIRC